MAGFITVTQFSKEYSIPRTRAYAICYQPGFPAYRMGPGKRGTIRINVEELETWMAARQLSNPGELERTGMKIARRSPILTVQEQIAARREAQRKRVRRAAKQSEEA